MKDDKYLKLPHNCYLILTSKCNMRCKHCYGNYGINVPKKELTGEEWIKVIKDLSSSGIFFVNISGGEPTIHPDFIKIIDSLVDNEVYFMLTTNGVFNDTILNAIKRAKDYILGIQISLDGPDWESHAYLRRRIDGSKSKDLFDITLKNIKEITNEGIRLSVATCLHQKNIDKVDELKELMFEIKPTNWSLSTISISGRAKDNDNLFVSESRKTTEYWVDLKKECEQKGIEVIFVDMPNLVKTNDKSKIYYECPATKWFCEINSDGLTTPCPLARVNPPKKEIKWDNILEKDIESIWNGEPFNEFRKYQNIGCEGCTAKDKCDRCPPQSLQWFNDPLLPPPYCIENGELLCLKNLNELRRRYEEAKKKNNREDYGLVIEK